jgi:predicted RNase H-like HicB family nuclease
VDNLQKDKKSNDPILAKLLEANSELATQAADLASQMKALQEKRRSLRAVIELFSSPSTSAIETETKSEVDLENNKWYQGKTGQYNPSEKAARTSSSVYLLPSTNSRISIQIQKTAAGYSACSPEIEDSQVQGDSFENIVDALKSILSNYLEQQAEPKTNRPIWEVAQEITSDMTEEEIQQLPSDGAEQHDHYIYGTPKRLQ